jgi:hypothetical protein
MLYQLSYASEYLAFTIAKAEHSRQDETGDTGQE